MPAPTVGALRSTAPAAPTPTPNPATSPAREIRLLIVRHASQLPVTPARHIVLGDEA